MIKWYTDKVFPWLMKKNIGKKSIIRLRQQALSKAYGNILEIGVGTGMNLSLYPKEVTEITAIDSWVREIPAAEIHVNLVNESATQMGFKDNSFDTVVSTFTLCSIEDLDLALSEIYRVLKPGGQFIFLEHGKSKNKGIAAIQELLNSLNKILALGCNINRSYIDNMKKAGFTIEEFNFKSEPIYPRILSGHVYQGRAKK